MGLQMSFEDDSGAKHEESYWMVAQVNINTFDKIAHVEFLGFVDKAARDAKKRSIGACAYEVSGKSYSEHFSTDALKSSDPMAQSYALMKADDSSMFKGAKDV